MRKFLQIFMILSVLMPVLLFSAAPENMFGAGVQFGFGLPRTPYKYRTPFSLTGGLSYQKALSSRLMLRASANALTTFYFGTVNSTNGDLSFDLLWGNLCGMYKVSGRFTSNSYVGVGMGRYRLHQKYDEDITDIDLYGINLGIFNYRPYGKVKTFFDMRWHLLLDLDPQPQLLTVTFGFLI